MPTKRQRRKKDVKQNPLGFIRNSILKVDIMNLFVDRESLHQFMLWRSHTHESIQMHNPEINLMAKFLTRTM